MLASLAAWYGAAMMLRARLGNQGRRAALAFVYVTALLDMMAFGVVIPVLPFLVKQPC
jgi:hypothetical protein